MDPWRVGAIIDDRWEVFDAEDGGVGRVFFVRDRLWDGMPMAVKTLKAASIDADATLRELFRRETQTWLDLGAHPHIVSGFYTLELHGALRFFMELVPGRSLDRWVARVARVAGRRPSMEEALDLAIQIAFGMEYVHARGVVHRDLKPANCLVLDDGTLRVTDFGLGRSLGEADGRELQSEATAREQGDGSSGDDPIESMGAGTPVYMAPEQWRALRNTKKPADVYAFGVVLYEILAGAPPFSANEAGLRRYRGRVSKGLELLLQSESPSPRDVLRRLHEEADPLPLRDHGVSVPGPLETVVRRCLDKDPERRPAFGKVREMLVDLFEHIVGRPYGRKLDAGLEPSEAGENNRAVSYMVMGDAPRAKGILDRWLAAHPLALYPWINRRIAAVEEGEEDAAAFAAKLEAVMRPAHAAAFEQDRQISALRARLRRALFSLGAADRASGAGVADRASGAGVADRASGAGVAVDGIATSPDSAFAVLVGQGGLARAYALQSGEVVAELRGHGHRVVCAAFSPDGRRLVTGSWDRTARVWDTSSWACERVLQGPRAWTTSAAWSPDGALVAAGSEDGDVIVWDRERGRSVLALDRHESSVQAIAWSPDGAFILTGTRDGRVRASRFPGGDLARELPAHGEPVALLSFIGETQVVSAGRDGAVRALDVTGDESQGRALLSHGEGLLCAAVSARARLLATGSRDGRVRVFRLDGGALVRDIEAHEGPVRALAFAGEGSRVLSGSEDGTARLWGARGPRPLAGGLAPLVCAPIAAAERVSLAQRRDELVARLASEDVTAYEPLQALRRRAAEFERDPEILSALARAGRSHGVCAEVRGAWIKSRFSAGSAATSLAFAVDGRLWVGSEDGALRAHKPDGSLDAELRPPFDAGAVTAVACSGAAVAAAFADRAAFLWGAGEQEARALEGHTRSARAIALSSDGERVATGSDDLGARLFGRDGSLIRVFEGHRGPVVAVAFTPDDRFVLTASTDGVIRLFSAETGAAEELARVVGARLESAAFREDGRLAAVRTSRATAQVYDLTSGKVVASIPGHTYFASPVGVSPLGRMLITGSDDLTDRAARLWDAGAPRLLRAFDQQAAPISALAARGDGLRVATGARDGSVVVWELDGDFRFFEDVLAQAEAMCNGDDAPFWLTGERPTARAWIDMWRDLRRCAISGRAPAGAGGRIGAIAAHVRAQVEAEDSAEGGAEARLRDDAFGRPLQALERAAPELFAAPPRASVLPSRVSDAQPITTKERLLCGAFSPSGELLALGGREGVLLLAPNGSSARLEEAAGEIIGIAWSRDGARLAVATARAIRVFSVSGLRMDLEIASVGEAITSIALAEGFVVAGTRGSRALVFNASGALLHTLDGHTDAIAAVSVNASGTRVVTASLDGTLRVWGSEGGAALAAFAAHARGALCARFVGEERVLSGGSDGRARLWDLEGRLISSFGESSDDITAVDIRPDGRVVAASGRDRNTRLWDAELGTELLVIPGERGGRGARAATSLSFSFSSSSSPARSSYLLVVAGTAQILRLE